MNPNSQKQFDQDMKNAASVADMLAVLGKYYDLASAKPGSIAKGALISGLKQGVIVAGVKPKSQFR
jgi:hypothetical protein